MHYVNSKGKAVHIAVSAHARCRFFERYNRLYPEHPMKFEDVDTKMEHLFKSTNRVKNLSGAEKQRMKRYGEDTLLFRTSGFTFIVQNGALRTVEISDRGKRDLN